MANKLNLTGLAYFYNRIKTIFAAQDDLDALSDRVDEIVAEGGEPNVIETVKVNGAALTPDAQKAVDVTVPQDLSDLTNTGQDPYATEGYVDQNGGKIDTISVNNTPQTITNKNVNITVPTKASDLTNDSGYQTANDVDTILANSGDPYQTESDVESAINTAVASAYKYKGSVANQAALPASGNETGDVYDTQDTGMNYAWNGTAWDALGTYVDMSLYWSKAELVDITTAEIDAIIAGN